jgi:hypothetical protein
VLVWPEAPLDPDVPLLPLLWANPAPLIPSSSAAAQSFIMFFFIELLVVDVDVGVFIYVATHPRLSDSFLNEFFSREGLRFRRGDFRLDDLHIMDVFAAHEPARGPFVRESKSVERIRSPHAESFEEVAA